ncbi:FMN-binding protein [Modestobacter muralis]|uniref:FMN-binding protein n=1 Tax=Modestobacter muralis TaxID=1608614 RepID=UPI001B8CBA2A
MIRVKKIVLWFMSTVTVVVLLFGYHTSTSSTAVASAQSSAVAPVTSGAGTSSGSSSGSSTSGTSTSTTFTGDSASTRWGPVQVEITVAGGTVTDVSVVDYPDGNGKDRQINARALPVLVQETLDAQSADIDMVSGATVTSDGYVESLQSALDQAGL